MHTCTCVEHSSYTRAEGVRSGYPREWGESVVENVYVLSQISFCEIVSFLHKVPSIAVYGEGRAIKYNLEAPMGVRKEPACLWFAL